MKTVHIPQKATLMLDKTLSLAKEHDSGGRVKCVAMFTDKRYAVLAVGRNLYTKTHPQQKAWASRAGNSAKQCLHAEVRAAIMLAKNGWEGRAAMLFVGAVSERGTVLQATPCPVCRLLLETDFPDIIVYHT